MMRQRFSFLLKFVSFMFSCDVMMAQHYYHGNGRILYSVDLNTCEVEELFTMNATYGDFLQGMAFHPNGRLYATATEGYLEIDPRTWTMLNFVPWSQTIHPFFYNNILFDENGIGLISKREQTGPGGTSENHLYYYDIRNQTILQSEVYPSSVFDDDISLYGKIGKYYINKWISIKEVRLFDLETLSYVTVASWPSHGDKQQLSPTIEYPICRDQPLLMSTVIFEGRAGLVTFDISTGEVVFLCENEEVKKLIGGAEASPTDFRRSPLRIDLDDDNSSGHITAGYYDTLTSCRNEVPLMDDDMKLYTCGAEVDSISFRLKYYDDPLLTEELIYSDGFTDPVRTSPSRYVWQNTYGADKDKIKKYLRSLHYRANWSDPGQKERVVMTTMHVGNDSTTSWSVYQLKTDKVYAGRDTMITYCSPEGVIDLVDYLSPDVSHDGRLEPVPAGGGTLIDPRVDQEIEYMYILEKGNCADTAVLKLNHIKAPEDPEPVVLCSGEGLWYKLPPASYSEINWWDGSQEDSIWLEVSQDTTFYVETVIKDTCSWVLRVPVRVREVAGLAGVDQTHTFCAGGPELDLNALLPVASGMDRRLEPVLSGGDLIFRPGEDAAGEYQYIISMVSCADTALITLEEFAIGVISFDAVHLCGGSEVKVGLPPGAYQNIRWWNGDSGDSATISDDDNGPFTLEAYKDGCVYQGEVPVTVVPEVVLPDDYPDQMVLCAGDPPETEKLTVTGLDSVLWENSIYYPGEEIMISREGEYILRGYQEGCFSKKTITVEVMEDPSASYSYIAEWCGRQSLTIKLPEDNATWRFRWEDGTDSSSRTIDSIGRHPFLIESDSCTFTGFYDVIESTDCDEECTVSIPNALTPNGDGINDNLEVFSSCSIRVTEIRIFDKWGGEIYSVQGGEVETTVWEDLPPGVVMVQVTYETGQRIMKTVTGGVLIIK